MDTRGVHGDPLTELTDIVLRIKEAIEDQNAEALGGLLRPEAKVQVDGWFPSVANMTANARDLVSKVEQPALDIQFVESSHVQGNSAVVAYVSEFSWIDRKTSEERSSRGVLTLHFERARKAWTIDRLTYASHPDPRKPAERPEAPSPQVGAATLGLGSLIPCLGKRDGRIFDVFSFWY